MRSPGNHWLAAAATTIAVLLPCVASAQTLQPATATAAPLTLTAAAGAALAQNPAAIAARQQYLQAQARVDQTQSQLRAPISFSSSVGISNANVIQAPPSEETFGSWTNTISLPLALGRKPRLALTQATLQLQAAQATWDGARLALVSQVDTAFYDLLRKEALLVVAHETESTAARQLEDARKRFAAGDVPELDVLRAQVPVSAAQAGVYAATSDVAVARQTLNSLIGRPLDAEVEAESLPDSATTSTEPRMSIEEARATAVRNSPDVRSAEAQEMAADFGVKIAGLSREPVYALQLSDARSGDQTSFSRLDTLQATITIPLSDGGLAKAQQRESEAAKLQAHAQTETARRSAALAVSVSYSNVLTSARQAEAARATSEIAQTAYDKTKTGYAAGLFPLTDVLAAQSTLTQARVALTQARYDAAVARVMLNNSLGILP